MSCQNCQELAGDMKAVKTIVERIDKAVNGNGQPGLIQKVDGLQRWGSYVTGALVVVGFLLAASLTIGGVLLASALKH